MWNKLWWSWMDRLTEISLQWNFLISNVHLLLVRKWSWWTEVVYGRVVLPQLSWRLSSTLFFLVANLKLVFKIKFQIAVFWQFCVAIVAFNCVNVHVWQSYLGKKLLFINMILMMMIIIVVVVIIMYIHCIYTLLLLCIQQQQQQQ